MPLSGKTAWLVSALVFAALAANWPAVGKQASDDDDDDDVPETVRPAQHWVGEAGAGGALRPFRRGDNRYIFSPFPIAKLSYGDVFEASTRDGVSAALLSSENVRIGPELEIDRKERSSTRRFGPLATTFGTAGAGVFGEIKLPADMRTRLDVTQGVFGREGLRTVFSASRNFPIAQPLSVDLGFKMTGGGRRYVMSAYGSPAATNIQPNFSEQPRRGSAGVTAIGPTLGATFLTSSKDTLTASLEANHIVGVAARAPAVRAQGTRNAVNLEVTWMRKLFDSN